MARVGGWRCDGAAALSTGGRRGGNLDKPGCDASNACDLLCLP